mmetsp:Transcript_3249/g.4674  ORF Transcript_3249/g.4674 Transcript_3249/m.4674 type:complete len:100 (+) Transcript_3249:139-438(+)
MIADDTTSGEEYSSDLSDSDDQVRDPHADDLPEPIGSVTAAKQKKKKKPKKKIELPDMTDPEKQHFLKDVHASAAVLFSECLLACDAIFWSEFVKFCCE